MNKKELYTSPEVETLVVRFEGVVCQSPGADAAEFGGIIDEGWDA